MPSNYPPGFTNRDLEANIMTDDEIEEEQEEDINLGTTPSLWVEAMIWGGKDNIPLQIKRKYL